VIGLATLVPIVRWLLPYALGVVGLLVLGVAHQQGVPEGVAMGGKVVGACLSLLGFGWLVDRWCK
jgi:hypothetical protein